MVRYAAVVMLCALLPRHALAAEGGPCGDPQYGIHSDLVELRKDCWKAAAELNEKYKDALASLRSQPSSSPTKHWPTRSDLIRSQRDWLKYRDSWCRFVALHANWYTEKELACLVEVTNLRIQEIENLAHK